MFDRHQLYALQSRKRSREEECSGKIVRIPLPR